MNKNKCSTHTPWIRKLLVSLLILANTSCHNENPSSKLHQSANVMKGCTIVYSTTYKINPEYAGGGQYSPETVLHATIANSSETTIVIFNENGLRIEGMNSDYEYFSPHIQIRQGNEKEIYCKELHKLNFWLEYTIPPRLVDQEQHNILEVDFLEEEKQIAGFPCSKAVITKGAFKTEVFFTDKIETKIPDHLWLKHDSIPGVILEMIPLPDVQKGVLLEIRRVETFEAGQIPENVFLPPSKYTKMEDSDDARAENKNALKSDMAKELENAPLSETEKSMYFGHWLNKSGKDQTLITIASKNEKIIFRTTVLTNLDPEIAKTSEVNAMQLGRLLLIESTVTNPNDKVYELSEDRNTLKSQNNHTFEFTKISDKEALEKLTWSDAREVVE